MGRTSFRRWRRTAARWWVMPLPPSSTPPGDWLMAGMGALGGLVGSPVSAGTELVSGQVGVDSDLVGVRANPVPVADLVGVSSGQVGVDSGLAGVSSGRA